MGDHPKNWRATNPRTGGHQPENWEAAVLFNPVFVDKFFQSHPFVPVFTFLIDRTFGYVDVHEADDSCAERALPYGRRPDQPSSSSLARRVCGHCIQPSATGVESFSVLVVDSRVPEPAHDTSLRRLIARLRATDVAIDEIRAVYMGEEQP